jgi:hypothetical protein
VLLAAVISFGVYTAVKSTYVSTVFGTYTYERNLIYVAPLLFAGTALWLERRNFNPIAVVVSAAFVLYLLLTTPYEMGQDISYNAPGLAILQQATATSGSITAARRSGCRDPLLSVASCSCRASRVGAVGRAAVACA